MPDFTFLICTPKNMYKKKKIATLFLMPICKKNSKI